MGYVEDLSEDKQVRIIAVELALSLAANSTTGDVSAEELVIEAKTIEKFINLGTV